MRRWILGVMAALMLSGSVMLPPPVRADDGSGYVAPWVIWSSYMWIRLKVLAEEEWSAVSSAVVDMDCWG